MIRTKLFVACALAFVVSLTGTSATAQEPANQITYFTFSAPFELPGGQVLPAGKYVFRIADSPSNRHIVHVLSEDQTKMHATLFAVPAQRQDPAVEPEVRFMEAEADAAPAIRTWWYPGRSVGHEFIYPKDHARRLAARQSQGVLTVASDTASEDEMRRAELSRIGADGREAAWSAEKAAENQNQRTASAERPGAQPTSPAAPGQPTAAPSGQRTAQGAATERTADAPNDRTTRARTELPRTAGTLPLVALLGLGSLIGAGVLRLRR